MAPACRSNMLGAHRGHSVEKEAKLAVGFPDNVPAASSTIQFQHAAKLLHAPNGPAGSSMAPSSRAELQADGLATLGEHQLMHMHENFIDLNPLQSQESASIGSASLPANSRKRGKLPWQWQSISAPSFRDFNSHTSALSRGTSHPESSNRAHAAATTTHGLPGSLGQNIQIGRVPELKPLTRSEIDMLSQQLQKELSQSMENACSMSPLQKKHMHHLNGFGEPIQAQGVGSASSHSCSISKPYPMDRPSYPYRGLFPAINQDIIEAAPPGSITVFDVLAQLAICTAGVPNGSTNSSLTIYGEFSAQTILPWPHHGQASRYPERPVATDSRSHETTRTPTTRGAVAVPPVKIVNNDIPRPPPSQLESPEGNRLWSECVKRMKLRDTIIRSHHHSAALETWLDNEAKLVKKMLKQIKLCEQMEVVATFIKHLQIAARSTWPSIYATTSVAVSHKPGASAMAEMAAAVPISTLMTSGSRLYQASIVSANVAIHISTYSCFLTTSLPHGLSVGLLDPIVSTLEDYHLQVLYMTFISRINTRVYSFHFKVRPYVHVDLDDLHSKLQTVVNNFASASSS